MQMGKTGKWLKNLLTGNKNKDKDKDKKQQPNSTPVPKEKRRWSFRRPSESRKESNLADQSLASTSAHGFLETKIDPDRHAMAVAVATAAAADAAVAAAQAAAAMIRLTTAGSGGAESRRKSAVEEMAAVKIQSVFRSYLARKALCALKGLVKLQALVRGHLVRRQATETLRCMQALISVQTRTRMQRIQMLEDEDEERSKCRTPQRQRSVRNSPMNPRSRHQSHDNEDNVKIVEVDMTNESRSLSASKSRHDYHPRSGTTTPRKASVVVSPSPSAMTEMSPRTYSAHFDEFSFTTAQSGSPRGGGGYCGNDVNKSPFGTSQDYPLFPNYMANTKSSRAKARSQSAPKQRPLDSLERQSSTRRTSLEGRNIPKLGVRMQRSASQVGPVVNNGGGQFQFHYPWSVKLDKSSASLKDSECGSTSTVLTTTSYYSTLLAQEVHGRR